MTRAGIVTVTGKPNAGKSTFLNRVIGEKLSIVSAKPQSTRNRIVGIKTAMDVQMILLDTPGLLRPEYPLQRAMRSAALRALSDADVVLYLADATDGCPPPLRVAANLEAELRAPVVVALNKADAVSNSVRERISGGCPEASLISARTGEGVEGLLDRLSHMLPASPFLYPEEDISTQTTRFFVSELVRETVLEQLEDEVPYSVACEVEEFREAQTPVYIRAVLYVERESQKEILIGAQGRRIKNIGRQAREKIETLVGSRVYLDLWVKVLANWRRNVPALNRLGFHLTEDRKS